MSKWLICAGIVIFLSGILLKFAPGLLTWFGNLPGDIRIKGERDSIFFPITSMLVVSVIGTIIIHFFSRR